jgi:hypothetical protein
MFRIPDFHVVEMTFDEAKSTLSRLTEGGLLAGLEYMNKQWDEHCVTEDADDDDFYGMWCYECSAFNIVFEKMAPLFAEK